MASRVKLLTSQPLSYPPNGGYGPPGTCWLRLHAGEAPLRRQKVVAIVTELHTNPGPSVTNAAESVRARIVALLREYGIFVRPLDESSITDGMLVYEHYNDVISYGRASREKLFQGDRYSLVTLDEHGHARWAHTVEAEVDAAVGGLAPIPIGSATERGPSEVEAREMLRLLNETYSVLKDMSRSGLSMYEAWPPDADRLYDDVGEFLYPEGGVPPHARWWPDNG